MRRARARRRLVRDGLFAAVGLGSTGLAVWMLAGGNANEIATVASLFVGVAALLLALADYFRPEPTSPDPAEYADDLARTLREQWLEEAEARRLRDPRVLPLAWAATAREVADEPRVGRARVVRLRLDGRLAGRFEQVTGQLAEGYGQLAQGRLVVIGEPGAGKTVLAMLLTLGLLDARAPGTPVPVLLPVSSWDPLRERLDDWIVNSLAVPYYSGRPEIPRTLLAHGLLLPVLDGLDEIPESARRGAIRGINHAVGGERPVVVTCRAVEYEELIRGGAPRLRQAPVVEVLPLPATDVVAYLRDTEWPDGVVWDEVVARLSAEPDGPLAEALSTPMMVTTARLVYQRGGAGGADPRELLDRDRFDCRYSVEDHLTHEVVDAAYAPDPRLPEEAGVRQRWRPEQARRWLTFLAGYLHDHRERDLAWWSMSGRLLPTWVGPVASLLLGLVVAFGASVWVAVTEGFPGAKAFSPVAALTLAIGAGFALIGSIVWYTVGDPLPGRLAWSPRGSAARLRRGFRNGAVLCLAFVVPVAGSVTLIIVLDSTLGPGTLQGAEAVATLLAVCVAVATVMGLSLAAHSWLNAPPSRAAQVNPANSLVQDRRSSLCGALLAGVVFGATGLFGLQLGLLGGGLLFRLVNDWPGWPGDGETGAYAEWAWGESSRAYGMEHFGFGVPYLLPGTLFALLVLLSRAWPRFVLTRVWLAARGRLPWRLMAFLADARRREILRQSGGAYQFRHIRLQEALAGRPTYDEPRLPARRWEPAVVRRRVVLAAGVAAALSGTGAVLAHHRDESEVTFSAPADTWVTTLAFRPRTSEVFWGDSDGRIWSGSPYGVRRRRVGAPPPYEDDDGYDKDVSARAMAFHPGGEILALRRGGQLELWDVRGRRLRRVDSGPLGEPVVSLAFAPDGGYLAGVMDSRLVPSSEYETFLRRLAADGRFQETKALDASVTAEAVCFLPEGGLAVLYYEARVRTHTVPELEPGQSLDPHKKVVGDDGAHALTVSPRGDFLLVMGDEASELWQLQADGTWVSAGILPVMSSAAFHPAEPLLAFGPAIDDESSGLPDGTIELLSVGTGTRLTTLHGHMSEVTCMQFSSDGDWLATGSADGTVRLWDARRPKS
ncbi:WD40 repeat domain-containing protein [Streptomyces spinoverrucosus]|uniref:WD40 repeat domain-containing protein n=1 Tax=Streptomyces spinoverrucosus TaxID=284043 RepID=UPI001142DA2B|nr:WD40 repeat domain-containing protein [Streptomyces spinoverrucosus]